MSNLVPSSAASGSPGFFGSSGMSGEAGVQGGAGTATAGPLLINTMGDEIEIEAGVIEMQLPPTCSDRAEVALMLMDLPVIAIVPTGHCSTQFPRLFCK